MLAVFLDLETTGLDPTKHCVIDMAFKIVDLSTDELKYSFNRVVKQSSDAWQNRDLASIEINGYTWEEISLGTDAAMMGKEIIALFTRFSIERGKAVFICQNPAFDRGFFTHFVDVYTQENLNWPYHWLDLASMYWVVNFQKIVNRGECLPEKMSLSKNDIAKEYLLPAEATPHRAMNGVEHLILCYQAVFGLNINF